MFQYYQPTRIYFGDEALEKLGGIASEYGKTCLLVTTPGGPLLPLYERIKKLLAGAGIRSIHFDKVQPNPEAGMVEEGFALMKRQAVDFVLAVGGGSSMDTGKVLAFCNGRDAIEWDTLFSAYASPYENYGAYSEGELPLLTIPTTSGTGSQVTQAAVISRGKEKLSFYHPHLFSKACIIAPSLMCTMPARVTASTGFDAFAHAFESLCSSHASVYSEMDSMAALKLVIENLPAALARPQDVEIRSRMAQADTLAGRALANAGAGVPHPLSEIIGGIAKLPHGEALAVVFPAFVKHYAARNREKFVRIAKLFDAKAQKPEELYGLLCGFLSGIGLFKKLSDCGVGRREFEEILSSPVLDVLPFGTREELEAVLRESYE